MLAAITLTAAIASSGWVGGWSVNFELGAGMCFLEDVRANLAKQRQTNFLSAMIMFVDVVPSKRNDWPIAAGTDPHEMLLFLRFPLSEDPSQTVASVTLERKAAEPGRRMEKDNGVYFRIREPESRVILDKLERRQPIAISATLEQGDSYDIGIAATSLDRFRIAAKMFAACGEAIGA